MVLAWLLGAAAVGMIAKAARVEAGRRARARRIMDDLRTLSERIDEERRAA